MELKLVKQTKAEFEQDNCENACEEYGYGADVVAIYWTEQAGCPGGMVGILRQNGSCSVYGCRRDEEHITFAEMLEVIVTEWTDIR